MDNIIFAVNILQIESHAHQYSSVNIASQFTQNNNNIIERNNDPFHEEVHRLQEEQTEALPLDGTNCTYEKDENGIVVRSRSF